MEFFCNGLVAVAAKQKFWCFPRMFLVHQDDLSSLPWSNPLPNADNLASLKNYLKQNPDQVCSYTTFSTH